MERAVQVREPIDVTDPEEIALIRKALASLIAHGIWRIGQGWEPVSSGLQGFEIVQVLHPRAR